ncbi:MAG: hypothetical protein KDA53_01355 [Hyphomonas sp.]|nr:hypothetical protein [Hyphomonas sp.]
MSSVYVEREIYCRQDGAWEKGLISVHQPYQDTEFDPKGETWRCDIAIQWPGFSCRKRHLGSDSYQALELAFRLVPSLIAATDEFRGRNLALHEGKAVLDSTSIREFFHARLPGDV